MPNKISFKNAPSYTWGKNCKSWILSDHKNLSVKEEMMPTGTKEQLHFHSTSIQFFYILKGEAIIYINNEKHQLKSLEGISILPLQQHYISNEGIDDLIFLVISHPETANDRINL